MTKLIDPLVTSAIFKDGKKADKSGTYNTLIAFKKQLESHVKFATSVPIFLFPFCVSWDVNDLLEFNLAEGLSFAFIVIPWYLDCDTFLRSFHNRFFQYSIQTDNQFINPLHYQVLPSLLALIQNMLR